MSDELPFAPMAPISRRNAKNLRVGVGEGEPLARRIHGHGTELAAAAERATAIGRKTLMRDDCDAEPPARKPVFAREL